MDTLKHLELLQAVTDVFERGFRRIENSELVIDIIKCGCNQGWNKLAGECLMPVGELRS